MKHHVYSYCLLFFLAIMIDSPANGQMYESGAINYQQPQRPDNYKPFFYKYNTRELYEKFSGPMMEKAEKEREAIAELNSKSRYKPELESLNSHPVPEWFQDAKLGIFLDWGPWSVAGYAAPRDEELGTGGSYPDWYEFLMNYSYKHYHDSVWGEDFRRDDFLPLLTGENFDAQEYADLAVEAGARYLVPFSRHHAGWAMWESEYTFRNAMEMGPKRDIYKELATAARKNDLKLGFYFSVAEWEYPVIIDQRLSQWDPYGDMAIFHDGMALVPRPTPYSSYFPAKHDRMISGKIPVRDYFADYMMPLFKEGVDLFDPDLVWYDGGWGTPATKSRVPELSAYFYNQAEGRKEVVINNRAGSYLSDEELEKLEEARINGETEILLETFLNAPKLGDYTTPEYKIGNIDPSEVWEVCRSISPNFGYSWTDNDENSLSSQELVDLFLGVVSKNGNLLLVINPDGSGALSEVQRNRLLALGKWLEVNGEGIYKTRAWKVQQENGNYYTRSKDNKYVYLHRTTLENNTIRVPYLTPKNKSAVSIIGSREKVSWKKDGKELVINLPDEMANRNNWPDSHGFALKVEVE